MQYSAMGSGNTETVTVNRDSSGGSVRLSRLEAATVYGYRVAAMTSAGPGAYSTMTTLTPGINLYSSAYTHVCLIHFFHAVMAPVVMEFSSSPFSISITWTSSGAVVDSYEVVWERYTLDDCPDEHTGSASNRLWIISQKL